MAENMSFEVRASPGAPAEARDSVLAILGDADTTSDILLATSELVSNAVLHGDLSEGDLISVRVDTAGDFVRVTVSHAGPAFDRHATRERNASGGFGLHIVGALAKRWDVDHRNGRTETWFEI